MNPESVPWHGLRDSGGDRELPKLTASLQQQQLEHS